MHQVFFWIFASVAVGAGLLAITRKAALHCALQLFGPAWHAPSMQLSPPLHA